MAKSFKTVSITITYNPDITILTRQLRSLESQCDVVIVDNGTNANTFAKIKQISKNKNFITLIALDKNIGISNAQNIGIEYLMHNHPGIHFVLFLDHDSIPPKDMIKALEIDFEFLVKSGNNPAALGPLLFDPRDKNYLGFHLKKWGFWLKKIPTKPQIIECQSLNSSGSLISIEALNKVGLLQKDFFMDHGETEWCFRAIDKGYKIFGTSKVVMEHNMGDEICEYWFFGNRRMPYRSPQRHYYIIRNSILLQKISYIPLTWKFWNIIKVFFTFSYFGFVSKETREQRYFIWKGICEGLKGVTGKRA